MRKTTIGAAAVIAAVALGTGATAWAASSPTAAQPAGDVHACVKATGALDFLQFRTANYGQCAKGDAAWSWAQQGLPGKDGAPGAVAVSTTTSAPTTLAAIGGSWTAGHTAVKTVTLAAGTYQADLTGDFYRAAASTATPVLQIQLNGADHQLTGYTGAFPYDAAEATGVSGGTPAGLEQTATATGLITIPAGGATVEVDAFGYNPDRGSEGSGDFGVIATLALTQITPAS